MYKLNVVEKSILIGDPKYIVGRVAIVIDDMVDTMGTILKTSETLIDNGVSKIIVVVTHGILSGPAIDRLNMSKNVLCVKNSNATSPIIRPIYNCASYRPHAGTSSSSSGTI